MSVLKKYEDMLGGSTEKLIKIPEAFDQYIRRANKKKIKFELSLHQFDFLCKQPCFHCGIEHLDKPMGVDRVNNKLGYIVGNVAPCCWNCNRAKSDMSQKEFYEYKLRLSGKKVKKSAPNLNSKSFRR